MHALSRDDILNADDLVSEAVKVPEWNGIVYIRTMTGKERDQFESSLVRMNGVSLADITKNLRARLVCLTAVDEKGELIFTTKDIDALGDKNSKALDRLYDVAERINGLTEKDVKALEENLKSDQSASSTSPSPKS